MPIVRRAFLVLLLALAACAPAGPPFAAVANTLPPPAPGSARIFFYRWLEPYETVAMTTAYLNGVPVGATQTGAVLYRDVAPGQYIISVQSEGVYPGQFKTVTVAAGQVVFARINSLRAWSTCRDITGCYDTFAITVMDPAIALGEVADLRLIPG